MGKEKGIQFVYRRKKQGAIIRNLEYLQKKRIPLLKNYSLPIFSKKFSKDNFLHTI